MCHGEPASAAGDIDSGTIAPCPGMVNNRFSVNGTSDTMPYKGELFYMKPLTWITRSPDIMHRH